MVLEAWGIGGVGPGARLGSPSVARLLILGGGCRALGLLPGLLADRHAVRIVTRDGARRAEIEGMGAECWIGSPDRLGTLREALEGVSIACWMLGTASGPPGQLQALHGPRLRSFLQSAVDSTLRGVVYDARGAPQRLLDGGAEIVRELGGRNSIPVALIEADPASAAWQAAAGEALAALLAGPAADARPRGGV
jgi:hypothetical protein